MLVNQMGTVKSYGKFVGFIMGYFAFTFFLTFFFSYRPREEGSYLPVMLITIAITLAALGVKKVLR